MQTLRSLLINYYPDSNTLQNLSTPFIYLLEKIHVIDPARTLSNPNITKTSTDRFSDIWRPAKSDTEEIVFYHGHNNFIIKRTSDKFDIKIDNYNPFNGLTLDTRQLAKPLTLSLGAEIMSNANVISGDTTRIFLHADHVTNCSFIGGTVDMNEIKSIGRNLIIRNAQITDIKNLKKCDISFSANFTTNNCNCVPLTDTSGTQHAEIDRITDEIEALQVRKYILSQQLINAPQQQK